MPGHSFGGSEPGCVCGVCLALKRIGNLCTDQEASSAYRILALERLRVFQSELLDLAEVDKKDPFEGGGEGAPPPSPGKGKETAPKGEGARAAGTPQEKEHPHSPKAKKEKRHKDKDKKHKRKSPSPGPPGSGRGEGKRHKSKERSRSRSRRRRRHREKAGEVSPQREHPAKEKEDNPKGAEVARRAPEISEAEALRTTAPKVKASPSRSVAEDCDGPIEEEESESEGKFSPDLETEVGGEARVRPPVPVPRSPVRPRTPERRPRGEYDDRAPLVRRPAVPKQKNRGAKKRWRNSQVREVGWEQFHASKDSYQAPRSSGSWRR